MSKSHVYSRRVEFRDTDAAGIVHFSVFFSYMEQAEHDMWRTLGTSVVHKTPDGVFSWPRVSAKCDYKIAIKFEQIIDIEVRLLNIGTKSLTFGFVFRRDDDLIAEGSVTTVCCMISDDRTIVSTSIPDELRSLLKPLLAE